MGMGSFDGEFETDADERGCRVAGSRPPRRCPRAAAGPGEALTRRRRIAGRPVQEIGHELEKREDGRCRRVAPLERRVEDDGARFDPDDRPDLSRRRRPAGRSADRRRCPPSTSSEQPRVPGCGVGGQSRGSSRANVVRSSASDRSAGLDEPERRSRRRGPRPAWRRSIRIRSRAARAAWPASSLSLSRRKAFWARAKNSRPAVMTNRDRASPSRHSIEGETAPSSWPEPQVPRDEEHGGRLRARPSGLPGPQPDPLQAVAVVGDLPRLGDQASARLDADGLRVVPGGEGRVLERPRLQRFEPVADGVRERREDVAAPLGPQRRASASRPRRRRAGAPGPWPRGPRRGSIPARSRPLSDRSLLRPSQSARRASAAENRSPEGARAPALRASTGRANAPEKYGSFASTAGDGRAAGNNFYSDP